MKLPNFSTINAIVIGNAMLDQYWEGEVKRVSPEAPVPIFSINK